MKIAFVVPRLAGGGAEYVAKAWASHLSESGNEVIVFATQPIEVEVDAGSFRVVPLGASSLFSLVRSLRRAIRVEGPDVVIGLMPFWNLLALAGVFLSFGGRPRVIVSSHTIESNYGVNRSRGFHAQTAIARAVYRFADAFLASSHAVAAEAVARYGIDRNRLWVVPNPVFPAPVLLPQRSRGIDATDSVTLVVPGRLVAQKRPGLALDVAFSLGEIQGMRPKVVFIGDGPALEATKLRAENMHVTATFLSWSADWPTLVPENSLVLLPSMLEGFGNVLLDAAASGFRVVASSRALGVADAVLPGVTGVLVSGDAVSDYVDGVLAAETLLPGDSVTVQSWMNRFSAESSGAQLLSVIKRLVK
ncbi:glycosyltransferase [Arthrobacter sp. MDT3-24]